jgi:hypothetical protein
MWIKILSNWRHSYQYPLRPMLLSRPTSLNRKPSRDWERSEVSPSTYWWAIRAIIKVRYTDVKIWDNIQSHHSGRRVEYWHMRLNLFWTKSWIHYLSLTLVSKSYSTAPWCQCESRGRWMDGRQIPSAQRSPRPESILVTSRRSFCLEKL